MKNRMTIALLKEIERVQEIVTEYEKYQGGLIASMVMRQNIREANEAILNDDLVAISRLCQELKEWKF